MRTQADGSMAPRWGRGVTIFLAVSLLIFALHRYVGGFDRHLQLVQLIAHDFAEVQLPVIRSYPLSEHLHRLGGSLLVLAGLLQFHAGLRRDRPRLHRAIGMTYVPLALIAAASGISMGTAHAFGGVLEAVPTVVFGVALIVVTLFALVLARRRRFEAHREWMARSYALVLGPMTIRLLYAPLWMLLGLPETTAVWVSFWLGWLTNLVIVEAWIRGRRSRLRRA